MTPFGFDQLGHQPWFLEALAKLGALRGVRVLQVGASVAQTAAVLEAVGRNGSVLVLEPDSLRAATIEESLDHDGLHVVAYRPDGNEVFGQHDAFVAAPTVSDGTPLDRWSRIALANLRPGGRFVLDLPGESHCAMIADACAEIGAPPNLLGHWNGPPDAPLARLLRAAGLRQIESSIATHLVRFDNPHEVARAVCTELGANDELLASLRLALVRRLTTNDEVELVFHRARLSGMR